MNSDNLQIVRLLKGDDTRQQGFTLMVDRYTERLYWHIRRMVVDHEDARDLLQETWIKAYDALDTFKGDAAELPAWLYKIATNMALGLLRRKYRRPLFFFGDDRPSLLERLTENASESAESIETRFQQALLSLPTKQRTVFNLRYYDELSYAEISRITGMSEATLKTNYHYAQKRIKELMTE